MTRVVVTETARQDLRSLITTRTLPDSTIERVAGPPVRGPMAGFRVILGPWPRLIIVYRYDEARDEVAVVTIQDARTAGAATAQGT